MQRECQDHRQVFHAFFNWAQHGPKIKKPSFEGFIFFSPRYYPPSGGPGRWVDDGARTHDLQNHNLAF